MARIQHTIPDQVKDKAESILQQQGFTPAVATTLFYVEVINHGGLPFQPTPLQNVPTDLTLKTLRDSKSGKNVIKAKNKRDFFKKLRA